MEQFLNRVFATLAAGIDDAVTSISLTTGHGARFGTIGAGNKVRIVFLDAALNVSEVAYMTAISTDTATIERGQDGTAAAAHLAGDRIEARIGKSTMAGMAQLSGATFTGPVLFDTVADIASAATIDLTSYGSGAIATVTGTTATSAFTMSDGQTMTLVAAGAWPLTYHATTAKIVGGTSYTCTAGEHIRISKTGGVVSLTPDLAGGHSGHKLSGFTLTSGVDWTNTTGKIVVINFGVEEGGTCNFTSGGTSLFVGAGIVSVAGGRVGGSILVPTGVTITPSFTSTSFSIWS